MAKIKIKECNVVEKNLYEIELTDIIYSIVIKEVKSNYENKKAS